MKKILLLALGFIGLFSIAAVIALNATPQIEVPMVPLPGPTASASVQEDGTPQTRATVMITNLDQNSGGSGSIVKADASGSLILTNAHVCGVVVHGGYVITDSGSKHYVVQYTKSKMHDLCLIKVTENLKYSVKLANEAPRKYSKAHIIGHPALFPTVITDGHFSGKQVIQVTIGMKPCSKEDSENPGTALFCMFFGQLPIVKNYEAILVSATIMPGSSGSAIYNEAGEISAVAFAGSGNLGYAFAVPYEYVRHFLIDEDSDRVIEEPDHLLRFGAERQEHKARVTPEMINFCNKHQDNAEVQKTCKQILLAPTL